MESRDLGLWFGLGVALVGMGEPAWAIQALERVTEKVKDRPEAWAWLGTAYARANRLEDARAVEKRLRADHPDAADRLLAEIERNGK